MESRKKILEAYLYSAVGVALMAALLIAVNMIAGSVKGRIDMTEENLYTLTKGTKAILKKMDTPVTIRFYASRDATQMPIFLKNYARRVEDLLKEYEVASGDKIVVRKFDPQPDSDAEDSANLDGVNGQAVAAGEKIYLGLAVSCLDQTAAVPFLSPEREALLEYDITRAIYRILNPEKPVLGIMSSLPIMGRQMPPMMMQQMPNQQNQPPWQVVTELKRDFDVREIQTSVEEIDADLDILMLVHAKDLSEKTLFAIDQFVLGGGRLLAFLDAMSMVESRTNPQPQMQMPQGSSSLGKLLDAWDIEYETEKVLADMVYMTRVQGRGGEPEAMPTVLSLTKDAVLAGDPVTSQLDSLLFGFAGVLSGDGADGITKEVLVASSEQTQLVEKFMAQMPGSHLIKDFKSEERKQDLAIRLTGTFPTAFPEGKPGNDADDEKEDKDGGEAEEKKDDDSPAPATHLTTSSTPGVVVLVADSDMLYDHFCIRKQNFLGQEFVTLLNDNLNFVQNLVEQLSGDSNLISIRCRGAIQRPFQVVRRMQAEAERKWQDKVKSLEDDLSETQRKINELQREKTEGQKLILSDKQKAAITKFKKKQAETRKELKDTRKKLRREIDSLQTRLKWANIALMPFLVSVSGILLSVLKRRRMVQK